MRKKCLTLVCFIILMSLPVFFHSVEGSSIYTMTLNVTGNINSVSFTASGTATVDDSVFPGTVTNTVTYSNIPAGWHPLIGLITIINTWKCPINPPAKNLDMVTGGNFSASRTLTIKDSGGTTLGTMTLTGYVTKLTPTSYQAVVTITGSYSGPTNPTSATGYQMNLHQVATGMITGSFIQTVSTPGDSLQVLADTTYTYTGGSTLPQDEISHLRIDSISFVGSTLSWTGAGWYDYEIVGGVAIPVDKFGLLAPYIGLASTIIVAAVAATVYVKRIERRKVREI